jgi:hypothetical protein
MLDDVQRGRLLVEPSREDPVPALVGLLNVNLDEGPGKLLEFPWGRCLACAQSHDDILPACRLAGVKSDVLDDAVTLVENAKNSNPLGHRSSSALPVRSRGGLTRRRKRNVLLLGTLAAPGKRKPDQQRNCDVSHAYSGIQGS